MEAFRGILQERNGSVDEIPGQKEEERDVKGVNELIKEREVGFKVVVSQNHQQNTNASCNVKILDSFRHHDVSFIRFYNRNRLAEDVPYRTPSFAKIMEFCVEMTAPGCPLDGCAKM